MHVYVQMPACVYPSATGYQPKSKSFNAAINSQAIVTSHKSKLVTGVLITIQEYECKYVSSRAAPTAKQEAFLCLSLPSSAGLGFGLLAVIWTNCFQLLMMPLQSSSYINGRLLSFVLLWERLNQMGKEKGSDREREKEKQRRQRVRRYLCLTDEYRGRKKIIVDRNHEKYQSSKRRE